MSERIVAERYRQSEPIIALTHEFFPDRGGIATYVREVARAVACTGRRIEVWAPSRKNIDRRQFPFVVKDIPVSGSQGWLCRLRLAMHLEKYKSEWRNAVCYLAEPGPIITWMYLQLLRDIPAIGLVVSLHGTEVKRFCALFHQRLLFRRLLGCAQRIGVLSNYVKRLLLTEFPELESKTVLAPGAPSGAIVSTSPQVRAHSSSMPKVLLTVARIHPRKGQLAVLEALSRLPPEKREGIEYQIVGPVTRPSYFRKLNHFAKAHDLVLRHLGSLDEKALSHAYASADIFIMTSIAHRQSVEGFGLSYLEASAHGLPIIAHRIGGVEEAVNADKTGILVSPDDREGLSKAIDALLADANRRKALGQAGRQWVKRFSWHTTARSLFGDLG